ncbi:MAG: putative molybdopterin-binding oxidoreductase [Nocardioides sp.]|jgi:DMSO/TMAO reductase YedYZ molybdopterin-dependent catalytic subunit|uniref:molybdopterin-dependent oxidoreductase n=1 Tax=Nocardioides sp. TaxID=35761 RepID=UPI00261073B9|nr:molybdopterin-dependent oxidoreductase [Nocardioides sp.]MCW2833123.1 putative molybdopterin-binding oxidoreductase [Nocardioides sp.]
MTRYWPRAADGLPPGQGLLAEMPRFSAKPFLPPPAAPSGPELAITLGRQPLAQVAGDLLESLGPRDVRADFHCVTTWSVTGLVWRGVPLREVLAAAGITEMPAPYAVALGTDRQWASFVWEDLSADDVLLATHLDGEALDGRHGGPLRLVTPSQYGYKNVKHFMTLNFQHHEPAVVSKQHLRARVALEERHTRLSARALRLPYGMLVGPTARPLRAVAPTRCVD